MGIVTDILRSMRIRQWTKNLFIFAPLIFSGKLFNTPGIVDTCLAFLVFSFVSSGVYIMNDMIDRDRDRAHPVKRSRPVASGKLTLTAAFLAALLLLIPAALYSAVISERLFAVIAFYILLQILYSAFLKKAVILDIIAVALGFELRVWAGAVVIGVHPSVWLQLCVFLLAIFLGALKRRHEKNILLGEAVAHRDVLDSYEIEFLDQIAVISAGLAIVFYGLYTVSGDIIERIGSSAMAYTIPFVIYGIFRYLYVVRAKNKGGDPGEVLLSDLPLASDVVLWITVSAFLIYRS